MGNDFPIEGDKLKKLIKKSRNMPIPFGFNPGTADEDDEYLAAHAKKAPEILGKLAQSEGAGTKSAFGTFAVDGTEVHLTCFRTIPQLAKKFKLYLKRFKIILNCVVMDPDGNVLDTDVETLDNWEDVLDEREDEAGTAEEEAEEVAEEEAGEDSGIDPADLAARLRALQPKIAAAPPGVLDRVVAGFAGAVGLVKAGKLEAASVTIAQLEAIMARLAAAPRPTATTQTPPPSPPPQPPQPESKAPAGEDPRLPRLREAVAKLSEQVGALLGNGAGPLLDDLVKAEGLIDAGETEAAISAMRAVQEALRNAQAAREKWEKAAAILEPQVTKALSGRTVADPDTLRTRWQFAVTLAAEGGWERALAAVPAIVEKLREPAADSPAGGEPPEGVVAFQQSRVLWSGTRNKMLLEARKLADAIVAQSTDDPDAAEIRAASEEIVAQVEGVDTRLQDLLEQITVAEDARKRAALKTQAASVISEYRALLASGIFPMIDNNPFAPVAVASSARMALDQIARTLA